ncbi:hypothetical protein NUW54_g10013 [Trametes sanguinea]|uniref:Uncharacterized protein n=1 Tax=Trametes sanguinea TaxID=158606 RepID=A0ACC1P3N6_9APHY|nr:hypothetical protein NUW54_g10013 [Trametes sanguinea]
MEGRCSPLCGFGGSSSKGSHASQEKGKEKEKERMRGARERSWERERQRGYDRKEKEREKEKEQARERRKDREKEKEREHITHPRRVGSPLPRDHRPRESTSAVAVASAVAPVLPLEKTTSADGVAARAKRIKHGSFDFERPISAGVGVSGASTGVGMKAALRNMGVGGDAAPHPLQRSLSARGTSRRGTDESLDRAFAPSYTTRSSSAAGRARAATWRSVLNMVCEGEDIIIRDVYLDWGARVAVGLAQEWELRKRGVATYVDLKQKGELPWQRMIKQMLLLLERTD